MPQNNPQPPKKKYTSIPLSMLVYIAWRNLTHKKLRSFLTVFGVVIGIGAIFFLLSFGIGLQRLVTSQVVGNQSVKSIDVSTPNSKIIKLDQANFVKMKNLPHVAEIGGVYSYAGSLKSQGSEVDTIVYGVDRNYQQMDNLALSNGRLLAAGDSKTVLVNQAALRAIGLPGNDKALGKKIMLRIPLLTDNKPEINNDFTIAGIVNSSGGNEVYIPAGIFSAAGLNVYSQVKIEVDNSGNVKTLRKQIESLGFLTTSPIDTVDQINEIFKFFNIILAGFGAIGMIVAVLGMFNTLTISLLERTKEIGLMVALGGRNRDMRRLFIFEAVLLSVAGAVAGIIGAIITGQIINAVMNHFSRSRGVTESFQLFAFPWWLISGTIAFMVCVGLAVVYFPARRAEHISPIDALRRE